MRKNADDDIKVVAEALNLTVDGIKSLLSASYVKEDTFVHLANIPASDTKTESKLMQIAGIKIKSSKGRVYPYRRHNFTLDSDMFKIYQRKN